MVFGYINALDLDSQNKQANKLDSFGVDKWFSEQVNGKINRSALDSLVERMRKGDKLVLCSLFSLPLTALQATEFLILLKREEIEFVSISEKIDQDHHRTLKCIAYEAVY